MTTTPRNLFLLAALIVGWAITVTAVATVVYPAPSDDPTCARLSSDATQRRYTVIRLADELKPPPHVSWRERTELVDQAVTAACPKHLRKDAPEGRRRPIGADLRGTVSARLRELDVQRRGGGVTR